MEWLNKAWQNYQGVLALLASFLAGLLVAGALMGFVRLPERVDELESWQVQHDSLVTEPGAARLDRLERQIDTLPQIQSMVFQLWCYQFPERCREVPREGES